jgi:hypothetical protein
LSALLAAEDRNGLGGSTRFAKKISFEEFLEYIQRATRDLDGREIQFYLDPVGLKEAGTSGKALIEIDLEGFPARTGLSLAAEQLGLAAQVRDGMVLVTSAYVDEDDPVLIDYYLVLGHSILAWFAAALGAVLVPLVAARGSMPLDGAEGRTGTGGLPKT